ncbi:MAG: hypothetical protein IKR69_05225 [Bacteroidales bacterium]|nr:hypothetical protein [Bacteroidales bacterium]
MRKLLLILYAAVLLASCNKHTEDISASVRCRIRLEADVIKSGEASSAPAFESAVNTIQILIFDYSGTLEKYLSYSGIPSEISADLKYGRASLHVFANYPDLSSVMTESALSSFWVNLSRNNEANGLVMYGHSSMLIPAETQASVVLVRQVAKVSIESIDISLDTDAAASALLPNNAHFLGGATSISADGSASVQDNGLSYSLTGDMPCLMYVYPVDGVQARIVVEADFAGASQYYSIPIGQLQKNTAYSLSLYIRTLGSPDPDTEISESAYDARISILRWSTGASFTENH